MNVVSSSNRETRTQQVHCVRAKYAINVYYSMNVVNELHAEGEPFCTTQDVDQVWVFRNHDEGNFGITISAFGTCSDLTPRPPTHSFNRLL